MVSDTKSKELELVQASIQTPPWSAKYNRDFSEGKEILVTHAKYPEARVWLHFYKSLDDAPRGYVEVTPGWEFPEEAEKRPYAKTYALSIEDGKTQSFALSCKYNLINGAQLSLDSTTEERVFPDRLTMFLLGLIPLFDEVPGMQNRDYSTDGWGINNKIWRVGKKFGLHTATHHDYDY